MQQAKKLYLFIPTLGSVARPSQSLKELLDEELKQWQT